MTGDTQEPVKAAKPASPAAGLQKKKSEDDLKTVLNRYFNATDKAVEEKITFVPELLQKGYLDDLKKFDEKTPDISIAISSTSYQAVTVDAKGNVVNHLKGGKAHNHLMTDADRSKEVKLLENFVRTHDLETVKKELPQLQKLLEKLSQNPDDLLASLNEPESEKVNAAKRRLAVAAVVREDGKGVTIATANGAHEVVATQNVGARKSAGKVTGK